MLILLFGLIWSVILLACESCLQCNTVGWGWGQSMLRVAVSRALNEILLSRGEVFYLEVLTLFFNSKCVPQSAHFL